MVLSTLKTLNLPGIQSTVEELVAFVKRQPAPDRFGLRLSRLLEWPKEENAVLEACVAVDDMEYDEDVLADLMEMDVYKVFVEERVVDVRE
ncbi:hypothetical protein AC579_3807 [Pseudocercospora musae]|uniref:Uncharacterized protein n=1 Tax=Pseudocercospora musae TaxID=113226 RepID=A0A139I0D0_9PEZI|nr:hypothetical protein AC579_3807 [Pseudocercospora musae]